MAVGFASAKKKNDRAAAGFRKRLGRFYGSAFYGLDLLGELAIAVGAEIYAQTRYGKHTCETALHDVLIGLNGRACRQYFEIRDLLGMGYPDAAWAVWRAMHETSVVMEYISKKGELAARLYLRHGDSSRYKSALEFNEHAQALTEQKFSEEELAKLRQLEADCASRFGNAFLAQWGWAARLEGKERLNFEGIEKLTGQKAMRPYYRLASSAVHPVSSGFWSDLGGHPSLRVLRVGPTNLGISDPGICAAFTIEAITMALRPLCPTDQFDAIIVILHEIRASAED